MLTDHPSLGSQGERGCLCRKSNTVTRKEKEKRKNNGREVQRDFWRWIEVKSNEWMEEEDEKEVDGEEEEECCGEMCGEIRMEEGSFRVLLKRF